MYAIHSGTCSVLVDPHYKETDNKLGEMDPKKTLLVRGCGGAWVRCRCG